MAGSEVGLFQEKAEVRVNMNFDDLSDEQLLIRLRDETEAQTGVLGGLATNNYNCKSATGWENPISDRVFCAFGITDTTS